MCKMFLIVSIFISRFVRLFWKHGDVGGIKKKEMNLQDWSDLCFLQEENVTHFIRENIKKVPKTRFFFIFALGKKICDNMFLSLLILREQFWIWLELNIIFPLKKRVFVLQKETRTSHLVTCWHKERVARVRQRPNRQ